MSTQRAMSSVSLLSHPSLVVFSFARYTNSCGLREETTLFYICERRDVLRAKLQDPCLASALSVAPQPTHKPDDIVHFGILWKQLLIWMLLKNDREQLIRSLRTHRVNTLTELRRIEKLFASNDSADVTEAMTTAWAHYVNSNNLLSELRGITKNYPFSSECLDEAKWQVIGDPTSTRSWNYCWLILTKIKNE